MRYLCPISLNQQRQPYNKKLPCAHKTLAIVLFNIHRFIIYSGTHIKRRGNRK